MGTWCRGTRPFFFFLLISLCFDPFLKTWNWWPWWLVATCEMWILVKILKLRTSNNDKRCDLKIIVTLGSGQHLQLKIRDRRKGQLWIIWDKWDGGKLVQRVVTQRLWRAVDVIIWWLSGAGGLLYLWALWLPPFLFFSHQLILIFYPAPNVTLLNVLIFREKWG